MGCLFARHLLGPGAAGCVRLVRAAHGDIRTRRGGPILSSSRLLSGALEATLVRRVFRVLERPPEPTAIPPQGPPPAGLAAFSWHYARQARGLVAALFVTGFIVALIDNTIPL